MNKFIISDKAYLKVALHSAKHPHASVNGVLVGAKLEDTSFKGDVWTISDAIPLLHHWTNLSPMMEVGLDLAQIYCKKNSLSILGFYQSTERSDETELSPAGQHVMERLNKKFPSTFGFVIDANRIPLGQPLFKIHMVLSKSSQVSKSQQPDVFDLEDESSPEYALRAIRDEGLQSKLGDFDDHLEDISVDWLRNPAVSNI